MTSLKISIINFISWNEIWLLKVFYAISVTRGLSRTSWMFVVKQVPVCNFIFAIWYISVTFERLYDPVCHNALHTNPITLNFEPPHDKTNKMTVRPAKTQISLGIRPVWSESSLCAQRVAKDPSFLRADSEDWSDWADVQADLSLRWAHMPFCWFCHEAAHLFLPICNIHNKRFAVYVDFVDNENISDQRLGNL